MSATVHAHRPTAQQTAIRTNLYEAAAELYPERDDFDEHELRAIRNEAIERCDMGKGKAAPSAFRTGNWLDWLLTPSRYSPFVDEVAVERALEFDVSALENLSDVEWFAVVDILAAMDDPFESADAKRERHIGDGDGAFMSEQRRRLRALPPALYNRLRTSVDRSRAAAKN